MNPITIIKVFLIHYISKNTIFILSPKGRFLFIPAPRYSTIPKYQSTIFVLPPKGRFLFVPIPKYLTCWIPETCQFSILGLICSWNCVNCHMCSMHQKLISIFLCMIFVRPENTLIFFGGFFFWCLYYVNRK